MRAPRLEPRPADDLPDVGVSYEKHGSVRVFEKSDHRRQLVVRLFGLQNVSPFVLWLLVTGMGPRSLLVERYRSTTTSMKRPFGRAEGDIWLS